MSWLGVKEALARRHSVRAFVPRPVEKSVLAELFSEAQKAPSWCNIQPWQVVVTAGNTTERVRTALHHTAMVGTPPTPEIPFPPHYKEPYHTRRQACARALYSAMGVAREDRQARQNAWLRNYLFFDAPHLLVVSRDASLGEYATLDIGVWLGIFCTVATAMGLSTCAMASTACYPQVLRRELEIPKNHAILFGVALGYEEDAVAANQARTTREPIGENIRFLGF